MIWKHFDGEWVDEGGRGVRGHVHRVQPGS